MRMHDWSHQVWAIDDADRRYQWNQRPIDETIRQATRPEHTQQAETTGIEGYPDAAPAVETGHDLDYQAGGGM
jgi:hypothetical protein